MGKHRTLEERIYETKLKLAELEERLKSSKKRKKTKGRKDELYGKILDISKATFYKYVKKDIPIMGFLDQFERDEIQEFLETGKVKKIELIKDLNYEELQKLIKLKRCLEEIV